MQILKKIIDIVDKKNYDYEKLAISKDSLISLAFFNTLNNAYFKDEFNYLKLVREEDNEIRVGNKKTNLLKDSTLVFEKTKKIPRLQFGSHEGNQFIYTRKELDFLEHFYNKLQDVSSFKEIGTIKVDDYATLLNIKENNKRYDFIVEAEGDNSKSQYFCSKGERVFFDQNPGKELSFIPQKIANIFKNPLYDSSTDEKKIDPERLFNNIDLLFRENKIKLSDAAMIELGNERNIDKLRSLIESNPVTFENSVLSLVVQEKSYMDILSDLNNYYNFEEFKMEIGDNILVKALGCESSEDILAPYQSILDNIEEKLIQDYPELAGQFFNITHTVKPLAEDILLDEIMIYYDNEHFTHVRNFDKNDYEFEHFRAEEDKEFISFGNNIDFLGTMAFERLYETPTDIPVYILTFHSLKLSMDDEAIKDCYRTLFDEIAKRNAIFDIEMKDEDVYHINGVNNAEKINGLIREVAKEYENTLFVRLLENDRKISTTIINHSIDNSNLSLPQLMQAKKSLDNLKVDIDRKDKEHQGTGFYESIKDDFRKDIDEIFEKYANNTPQSKLKNKL